MRSPLVLAASLLLVAAGGVGSARVYPARAVEPAASTPALSAPEPTPGARAPAARFLTRPAAAARSTFAGIRRQDSATIRRVESRRVEGVTTDPRALSTTAPAVPTSGAPQPILRGVALVEGGYGRAYFEDPGTGRVTGYALGDTVGDSRIEGIQESRVVLGRGDETVQLLLGVQSTAMSSEAGEADIPPQGAAAGPGGSPSSGQSSAIRWQPGNPPIVGNGQPWLDRLGIPQGALPRAIESASPAQQPNDPDD
jgi:hypothetical protein